MLIAESWCLCYHILMNEYFKEKISWYKMYAVFLLAALSGVVAWVFNNKITASNNDIIIALLSLIFLCILLLGIELRVRHYFKSIKNGEK